MVFILSRFKSIASQEYVTLQKTASQKSISNCFYDFLKLAKSNLGHGRDFSRPLSSPHILSNFSMDQIEILHVCSLAHPLWSLDFFSSKLEFDSLLWKCDLNLKGSPHRKWAFKEHGSVGEGFGPYIYMYPHSAQGVSSACNLNLSTDFFISFNEKLIYAKQSSEVILVYPTLQQYYTN